MGVSQKRSKGQSKTKTRVSEIKMWYKSVDGRKKRHKLITKKGTKK